MKARIYLEYQVGITSQKTEGARHILPHMVSDTKGAPPPRLPKIDTSVSVYK